MFFNTRLTATCLIGVGCGCGASTPFLIGAKCSSLPLDANAELLSKYSSSIFNCYSNSKGKHYQFSIALRQVPSSGNMEPYLKGIEVNSKSQLSLDEQLSSGGFRWGIQIYPDGWTAITDAKTGTEVKDTPQLIACDEQPFLPIDNSEDYADIWERSISNIKLELPNCKNKLECKNYEIKIADDVGLQWKDKLHPRKICWLYS